MAAGARKSPLLYVSDAGTGEVDAYAYPGGKLLGQLTGFVRPAGLCVDSKGDLFVTDLFGHRILEYAHAGKRPIETLTDDNEDPGDCSVNPASGELAVTNVSTYYSGPGDILTYSHAQGKPTKHEDRAIFYYEFCGYDQSGDLYVDGMSSGNFRLAELPAGGTRFKNISIDQKIVYAGAVQWDGANLAVGDYEANRIYQFQITGTVGTTVGRTDLRDAAFAIGFWLQGQKVIGPNDESKNVMFWHYPAGGSPTKTIGGLSYPWAATVSL
jgi:DNA-binding beta-propeller fold protein YncE